MCLLGIIKGNDVLLVRWYLNIFLIEEKLA